METPETHNALSGNKGMALLSYLGILVIVPLLSDSKNDPFVKFHAKQGLVLLIMWIVTGFLYNIPGFGYGLGQIIYLGILILAIMGILNVVNGKTKELPLVGQFAKNFTF